MKKLRFLPLLLLLGCDQSRITTEQREIIAIYMHDPGKYSVLYRAEDHSLVNLYFNMVWVNNQTPPDMKLIDDVPQGSNMWYLASLREGGMNMEGYVKVHIHIHSSTDVNAGGWNHGKGGHGQTTVLEN